MVNQKFTSKQVTVDDVHKVIDLTEAECSTVALDESDKEEKSDEDKVVKDRNDKDEKS